MNNFSKFFDLEKKTNEGLEFSLDASAGRLMPPTAAAYSIQEAAAPFVKGAGGHLSAATFRRTVGA